MKYRDAPIKVWAGIYELNLAYDASLGSKNPQGFGMVEVVNPTDENI